MQASRELLPLVLDDTVGEGDLTTSCTRSQRALAEHDAEDNTGAGEGAGDEEHGTEIVDDVGPKVAATRAGAPSARTPRSVGRSTGVSNRPWATCGRPTGRGVLRGAGAAAAAAHPWCKRAASTCHWSSISSAAKASLVPAELDVDGDVAEREAAGKLFPLIIRPAHTSKKRSTKARHHRKLRRSSAITGHPLSQ